MKKTTVKLLLVSLLCLIIIGCTPQKDIKSPESEDQKQSEKRQEEQQLKVNDFFPTNIGMYWDFSGEGNEYAAYNQKVVFKEGNFVQMSISNPGTNLAEVYEIFENEIRIIYQEEDISDDSNLIDEAKKQNRLTDIILKEPLKKGTSWSNETGESLITDNNVDVTVPLGTFKNCIIVETKFVDSQGVIRDYFAPNIGIIKREYKEADFVIKSELKEFNPAN